MRDAQGEEFKHFCMDLEFLLRRTPRWREIARRASCSWTATSSSTARRPRRRLGGGGGDGGGDVGRPPARSASAACKGSER